MTDNTGTKRTKTAFGKYKFSKRLGRFGIKRGLGGESLLREQTARVWKRNKDQDAREAASVLSHK